MAGMGREEAGAGSGPQAVGAAEAGTGPGPQAVEVEEESLPASWEAPIPRHPQGDEGVGVETKASTEGAAEGASTGVPMGCRTGGMQPRLGGEGQEEEAREAGKTVAGALAVEERSIGPEGATGSRAAVPGLGGAAVAAAAVARVEGAAAGAPGSLAG